jgi:hypothetical protein
MVLIGVATLFHSTRGIGQQAATSVPDIVEEAQNPRTAESKRPEQQKSNHDQSNIFGATNAPPSSYALETQPDQGKMLGFDFARDPLNAKRPMQPAEEIIKQDMADKPKVTTAQQQLLQQRYELTPRLDPSAKMSRGKPLPVGPTARLPGTTWQNLAKLARTRRRFPRRSRIDQ